MRIVRKKVRILLVEEHRDNLITTAKILQSRGYHVETAATKTDALRLSSDNAFDVLLADIELLSKGGLDLMMELAAKFDIKGIAYTGFNFEDDVRRSREAGYLAYLTKPTDSELLNDVIDRVMAPTAPQWMHI